MFNGLKFALRALFGWKSMEAELDEELRAHIARQKERYIKSGLPREEAMRRAKIDLGGMDQVKEECRDARGVIFMETTLQDGRYAMRKLRKNPGFTCAAVAALAMGIGANTAIFSVLNGVLLRPLPYGDPGRLVGVFMADPARPASRSPFSPQDMDDFRRQQSSLRVIGAYWYSPAASGKTLTGSGEPTHLETAFVDSFFFTTLGVEPLRGRTFVASEEVHGNDTVAVLSDHLWRTQFGGDPRVMGKTISLDGSPTTVIGIMPSSFAFPDRKVDIWLPLAQITDAEIPHIRTLRWMDAVGRLKPGVSQVEATAASSIIMQQLEKQYPQSTEGLGAAAVVGLRQTIVGNVRPVLLALFAAVALVLLMACVNLANLLLARGAARGREFAIRSAMGAARARLRRQSLTESLVLALLGGAASIVVANWMGIALVALGGASIPRPGEIRMDGTVILFAVVLSLLAGLLIGVIPALKINTGMIWDSLKAAGTSTTSTVQHQRGRDVLIVSEVALAFVLLAASLLVLKSMWKLVSTDPGFDARHVLAVELPLPVYKYSSKPKMDKLSEYRDELLRRVAAVPGVIQVGGSKTLPLYGGGEPYDYKLVDSQGRVQSIMPTDGTFIVTTGYFEALSIPILSGRAFNAADFAERHFAVMINHTLAKTYWPDENAVGKFLDTGRRKVEIIGVAGDVRSEGLNKPAGMAVYVPAVFAERAKLDLFVKVNGDPLSVAGAVRQAIQGYEPDQAISNIAPLEQLAQETLVQPRFFTTMLSAFGAVALLLAALGVFGVISYNVRQRTHEIGIRIALGATRANVLAMVLRHAGALLGIGAFFGLIGALIGGRLISGLLYGVSAEDPAALAASAMVLGAVALAAALVPAMRATRIDPMAALRYE